MAQHEHERHQPCDLQTPARNHYYYGKLLDVFHLEMEQQYFNSKRWLLNRLVTGPGVVCGLDVKLTSDNKGVFVEPGLAIDRCGHEIIVPESSRPVELPRLPPYGHDSPKQSRQFRYEGRLERHDYCADEYAHVVLCFLECPSDPTPVLTGDCESEVCAPSTIRERYKVAVREGEAPDRPSNFPDVITGRRINYSAIVEYVTRPCRPCPEDCCLPLANVLLRDTGQGWEPEIDITCRPIVYTNRLLYDLLVALVKEESVV